MTQSERQLKAARTALANSHDAAAQQEHQEKLQQLYMERQRQQLAAASGHPAVQASHMQAMMYQPQHGMMAGNQMAWQAMYQNGMMYPYGQYQQQMAAMQMQEQAKAQANTQQEAQQSELEPQVTQEQNMATYHLSNLGQSVSIRASLDLIPWMKEHDGDGKAIKVEGSLFLLRPHHILFVCRQTFLLTKPRNLPIFSRSR